MSSANKLTHRHYHDKDATLPNVASEIKALSPHIHPPVPNPAPMALYAFGLTTALLQVKHTRLGGDDLGDLQGVDNFCFGFALFFGGLLQFVGGLTEIKRNNVFGYTGFLVYGGFWMSYGASLFFVKLVDLPVNPSAVQAMLALMGIFTFVLFLCTLVMNITISVLLFLLFMTFVLLSAGVENETVDIVGGWFGMATAATAYWLATAELLNAVWGKGERTFIPLGEWKNVWNRRRSATVPLQLYQREDTNSHDEEDVESGVVRMTMAEKPKQQQSFRV